MKSGIAIVALLVALSLASVATAASGKHLILAANEFSGDVVFMSSDGENLGRVKVGYQPHEIAISKDKRFAYISNFGVHDYNLLVGVPGYYISVIDISLQIETSRLYLFPKGMPLSAVPRAPHGLKLSPDGTKLWVNTEFPSFDGSSSVASLIVFDLVSGATEPMEVIRLPANSNLIHSLYWSPDGKYIWLQLGRQGFSRYTVATGNFTTPTPGYMVGAQPAVRGLSFGPDGALVISGAGEILIYNPPGDEYPPTLQRRLFDPNWKVGQFFYTYYTKDGRYMLTTSNNGQVYVFNYASGELARIVDTFGLDPVMAVAAPDGRTAYAGAARGGSITKIHLDRDPLNSRPFSTVEFPTGVADGPNGIAIIDYPAAGFRRNRLVFHVVAIVQISACTTCPLQDGYKIKSAIEFWKERVNSAGGLPLSDGRAAMIRVTYRDDRNDTAVATQYAMDALDDTTVGAVIMAEPRFRPTANLRNRYATAGVPMLTVYPLAAAPAGPARRDAVEEGQEHMLEAHSRQVANQPLAGQDYWVNAVDFSSQYLERFVRNATVADAQAMMACLTLQEGVVSSGVIRGPGIITGITSLNATYFYQQVRIGPNGLNTYSANGAPVLVNLLTGL